MHAQPPSLFIIHKRERLSPEESKPVITEVFPFLPEKRLNFLFVVLRSSPLTGVLHHQQQNLPVPGPVHRIVQQIGKTPLFFFDSGFWPPNADWVRPLGPTDS